MYKRVKAHVLCAASYWSHKIQLVVVVIACRALRGAISCNGFIFFVDITTSPSCLAKYGMTMQCSIHRSLYLFLHHIGKRSLIGNGQLSRHDSSYSVYL